MSSRYIVLAGDGHSSWWTIQPDKEAMLDTVNSYSDCLERVTVYEIGKEVRFKTQPSVVELEED